MTYNYDFVENEKPREEIILGHWYRLSAISTGNKISASAFLDHFWHRLLQVGAPGSRLWNED